MSVLGFFRGKREAAKPKAMQGAQGFTVTGGYIQSNEINTKLQGTMRWKVASDLLTNISIIAAGVRYSLNLIARPEWSFEPANDSAEAKEMAEFAQSVLDEVEGTWTAIVRRMALYRWHGFGLHEWQAKEREDGRIGIGKIAVRPCHTVERWDMEETGEIKGVFQKRPLDGKEIYLPRAKVLYLVDDSLTDNPEGMGWFRHLVEPASRLKRLLEIETMGFERDLNGIPVGRAPISEINAMVGTVPQGWTKTFTQEDANSAIAGITSFVRMEAKKPGTGVLLDSQPYASQSADGESLTGEKMWDIELLTSEPKGLDSIAKAVERLEYEMSLVMGTDSMLTGRGGEGSRALSEDKSHNLYLLAESTIGDIKEVVGRDLLDPVWAMNGLPDELKPKPKTESINFKDAAHIAQVLKDMATAGAVLAPDDPAIDDLRSLLDLPPQPVLTDEERGILMGTKPDPNAQLGAEGKDKDRDAAAAAGEEEPPGSGPPNPSGGRGQAQKFDPDQPRDKIGRWTSGNGFGVSVEPYQSLHPAHAGYTHRVVVDGKQYTIATSEEEAERQAEIVRAPRRAATDVPWETGDSGYGRHKITEGSTTLEYGVFNDGKGATAIYLYTPVTDRGKGQARSLMERFVAVADREGATVNLRASDFESDDARLGKFYGSLGFKSVSEGGTEMVRLPGARKFDPNQPRDPAGTSTGGQWTGGGVGRWDGKPANYPLKPEEVERAKEIERNFEAEEELTAHQKASLLWYAAHGGRQLNDKLRAGDLTEFAHDIEQIDSAIANERTVNDMVVWRGLGANATEADNLPIGAVITDHGYASTSAHPNVGAKFASWAEENSDPAMNSEPILMRVSVPAGTTALNMHPGRASLDNEHEVLLPRGAKMRITGKAHREKFRVYKEDREVTVIDLELVE